MIGSVRASLNEVVLSVATADDDAVPGPTPGKVCLNEAYSSSEGFCEFLLLDCALAKLHWCGTTRACERKRRKEPQLLQGG